MKLLSLVAILAAATTCKAQAPCTWLSTATAAGLLGADDSPFAQALTTGPEPCAFAYHKGEAVYSLRIAVDDEFVGGKSTAALKTACTSRETQLRGIGNQAILCDADKPGLLAEQVIGQVREGSFLISISSSAKGAGAMDRTRLRDNVTLAAEQVAGNMF